MASWESYRTQDLSTEWIRRQRPYLRLFCFALRALRVMQASRSSSVPESSSTWKLGLADQSQGFLPKIARPALTLLMVSADDEQMHLSCKQEHVVFARRRTGCCSNSVRLDSFLSYQGDLQRKSWCLELALTIHSCRKARLCLLAYPTNAPRWGVQGES